MSSTTNFSNTDPTMSTRLGSFNAQFRPPLEGHLHSVIIAVTGFVLAALAAYIIFAAHNQMGWTTNAVPIYAVSGGFGTLGLLLTALSIKNIIQKCKDRREFNRAQLPE